MVSSRITSPYAGVHVLVLGAAGFIGRWVARALSRQQAKLHLVVRNRASALETFKRYQIHGIPVEADLANPTAVRDLIRFIRPTVTFNLAAYGTDQSDLDETLAYQINARLVLVLTQVLSSQNSFKWEGQTLVHVGSHLEYGSIGGDLSEDSIALPTSVYGRSKLKGTQLLVQSCNEYGVRGTAARLFSVYGYGEHEGRLTSTLLRASETTGPVDLRSGDEQRDFTYVEDVADGLLRLGLSTTDFGQVVNLATGQLTSERKFVETAASLLGLASDRLNFGSLAPLPPKMQHAPVSIAKMVRLTGWMPTTTTEQGLCKTLVHREQLLA